MYLPGCQQVVCLNSQHCFLRSGNQALCMWLHTWRSTCCACVQELSAAWAGKEVDVVIEGVERENSKVVGSISSAHNVKLMRRVQVSIFLACLLASASKAAHLLQ